MKRVYADKRLAYYGSRGSDPQFWSDHWENVDWRSWIDAGKVGALHNFEKPFLRYLPKQGKILEAGCGVGQVVVALRARGYDSVGIEFSEKTVSMVNEYLNDCPIKVGDVRKLDYPDNYFSAYISLGVMEHLEEGPKAILEEANRVLKGGGFLLVSVPRIHAIRKLKIWLKLYAKQANGDFYQYAFGSDEFTGILRNAGFSVEKRYYYGSVKGIKDEVALFSYFYKHNRLSPGTLRSLENSSWVNFIASHMVLFVAKKVVNAERRLG